MNYHWGDTGSLIPIIMTGTLGYLFCFRTRQVQKFGYLHLRRRRLYSASAEELSPAATLTLRLMGVGCLLLMLSALYWLQPFHPSAIDSVFYTIYEFTDPTDYVRPHK